MAGKASKMSAAELQQADGPLRAISKIRDDVRSDGRALTKPETKAWCRRRWRFLFIEEAIRDSVAMEVATRRGDKRPLRQRIAERFLIDGASDWQDEQPEPWAGDIANTTLLFCPGMLNGMLPVRAFRDNLPEIEKRFSMRVLRADSNPLASCAANVFDIFKAINDGKGLDAGGHLIADGKSTTPGDVMLLGYSKGGPDILTTLAAHPELADRIRCAFFWSCPLLGTAAADDAVSRFKSTTLIASNADAISKSLKGFVPRRLKSGEGAFRRADEFDTRACTRDLCTGVREPFMSDHAKLLDSLNLPMFTVRAATQHNEVPLIQRQGYKALSRHDAQNDMQVACSRAQLPLAMATDLGVVRGHHWDIAYPAFVKRKWFNNMYHGFPKTAAIIAIVQLTAELGLID